MIDRSATVDLPLGPIGYRTFGPESPSRPVVFTHGALHNGELWSGVAELLAGRGITSYVPEWPMGAHRIPARAGVEISPHSIAVSLLAFLEELHLEDVTLVGGVDGGPISQMAIDIDPRRVGRLTLTNSPAFDQFPPAPLNFLIAALANPTRLRVAMTPLRAGWLRRSPLGFGLLANCIDDELSRGWIQPLLHDRRVRRDTARFLASVDPAQLLDVSTRLARFDKPVRLVWGTADPFYKLELARRLAGAFPDGEVVEVPGGRTFVALDAPDVLANEIESIGTLAKSLQRAVPTR